MVVALLVLAQAPGLTGEVGPRGAAPTRGPIEIRTKGATLENVVVDAEFAERDAVRVLADGVTIRHCEIRNGRRDGVEVYAKDVTIDSCRIHHLLNGTFKDQADAHGITGAPTRLTIRNCEIFYVSGDSVQFDPDRGAWTDVVIENCEFWTGPLPEDAAGFKKGEQPGENALDTKQRAANERSKIVIRNSVFHGWKKGGQIGNLSALNLKNHVEAKVENCVFTDNEIALRLRGGRGALGGAQVTVDRCLFYAGDVAIRSEDKIENLKVFDCGYGSDIERRFIRDVGAGFETRGEHEAPPRRKP
jgi:hypothetical protein